MEQFTRFGYIDGFCAERFRESRKHIVDLALTWRRIERSPCAAIRARFSAEESKLMSEVSPLSDARRQGFD